MLETLLSQTKVLAPERFEAADLDKILSYTGGADSDVCIIQDSRPMENRDTLIGELKALRKLMVLDKVYPNPKTEDIMEMADSLKDSAPSVIVGIGGGSALDSAKAIALILSNGGDLDDYLGPDATRKPEKKDVKLILIPTTAGTGAELTKFGVYTARSGRKYTLNNPLLQADVAVLVTEFTYTLPPALTAATGFDALSHALETLWNKNATPLSDMAAIDASVHILRWLETAYKSAESGGKAGRREMLMGAAKAGISFNLTGTAAVHALSFILSEEWHVPHGMACAFTLEDILLKNAKDPGTKSKLARIASELFDSTDSEEKLVQRLYDRIAELKKMMKMPSKFRDLDVLVTRQEIPVLFERSFGDPKMNNNIFSIEAEEMYEMLGDKI